MTDVLAKLYENDVPTPVREYIDERDAPAFAPARPKRTAGPVAPKLAEETKVTQRLTKKLSSGLIDGIGPPKAFPISDSFAEV